MTPPRMHDAATDIAVLSNRVDNLEQRDDERRQEQQELTRSIARLAETVTGLATQVAVLARVEKERAPPSSPALPQVPPAAMAGGGVALGATLVELARWLMGAR